MKYFYPILLQVYTIQSPQVFKMSAIDINKSLFVPHVFPNFSQEYVADAFADVGEVDRVDFVAKRGRDGKPYNAAYIHFKSLYDNAVVERIQDEIYEYGSYHMYHEDSEFYWIVLPNKAKKHIPGERKPIIDLGEAKSVSVKSTEKSPEKPPAKQCPGAPKKASYANVIANKPVPTKLEVKFDEYVQVIQDMQEAFDEDLEASEEAAQMAEIEAELEAEDENLISIDWRYVKAIEEDNVWLHGEVAQLRLALINLDQMYQAEKAKVRAFSSSVDL